MYMCRFLWQTGRVLPGDDRSLPARLLDDRLHRLVSQRRHVRVTSLRCQFYRVHREHDAQIIQVFIVTVRSCMSHVCHSLDDLLRAGITLADNVVIVNKETSNARDEGTLADCNTIVAVQTIFRYHRFLRVNRLTLRLLCYEYKCRVHLRLQMSSNRRDMLRCYVHC